MDRPPLQLAFARLHQPLPPIAEQRRRWSELDARRPHARLLSLAERAEFERLDSARVARMARRP